MNIFFVLHTFALLICDLDQVSVFIKRLNWAFLRARLLAGQLCQLIIVDLDFFLDHIVFFLLFDRRLFDYPADELAVLPLA